MNIPVYVPYFTKESLRYAHDALDSGWFSSKGMYLGLLEAKLKEFFNIKYVLLTNTGTAALHLIIKSLRKFFPELDTVLVPNNVYVAAWNVFYFNSQHYTLKNLDTNLDTWNFNIWENENIIYNYDIVLAVHNLGNIINIPKLSRKFPHAIFIEDNCEGFGGMYEEKYSGTKSLASAISFFGNKNVTSGEGGALLTNSEDVYNYSRLLWGQGQSNKKFIHLEVGYNYRMTNIEAAILLGQI